MHVLCPAEYPVWQPHSLYTLATMHACGICRYYCAIPSHLKERAGSYQQWLHLAACMQKPDTNMCVLQPHGGPYLPPRDGKVKKPSTSPSLLVPRRPRTRPDYHKIITASCEQLMSRPQETRCKDALRCERCMRRSEAALRA